MNTDAKFLAGHITLVGLRFFTFACNKLQRPQARTCLHDTLNFFTYTQQSGNSKGVFR